jgi:hypothetical protein
MNQDSRVKIVKLSACEKIYKINYHHHLKEASAAKDTVCIKTEILHAALYMATYIINYKSYYQYISFLNGSCIFN